MKIMKMYRIYTENKNLEGIKEILNRTFNAYTLFEGLGVWRGTEEKNLTIEILSEIAPMYLALVVYDIKKANNQEAVLLTWYEVESRLI